MACYSVSGNKQHTGPFKLGMYDFAEHGFVRHRHAIHVKAHNCSDLAKPTSSTVDSVGRICVNGGELGASVAK